jgi:hypothetical protein
LPHGVPPPVRVSAFAPQGPPPPARTSGFAPAPFAPPPFAPVAVAVAPPSLPTSLMHLGPGFIVTLVKNNHTPYTPLDPQNVPTHIGPEHIKPPSSSMLSSLDRFFEEVERGSKRRRRSRSRSR